MKHFTSSADIAVALLASATCGISGLPFKFRDEEGQEQTVADGAALGRGTPRGPGMARGRPKDLREPRRCRNEDQDENGQNLTESIRIREDLLLEDLILWILGV